MPCVAQKEESWYFSSCPISLLVPHFQGDEYHGHAPIPGGTRYRRVFQESDVTLQNFQLRCQQTLAQRASDKLLTVANAHPLSFPSDYSPIQIEITNTSE